MSFLWFTVRVYPIAGLPCMNCHKLAQPALQKKSMSLEAKVSQVVARVGVKQIAVFKKHAKKTGNKKSLGVQKRSGAKKMQHCLQKKCASAVAKHREQKKCNPHCKKIKSKKICKCACIALVQAVLRVCGLQVVLHVCSLQSVLRVCKLSCERPRYTHQPPHTSTIPHNMSFSYQHHNRPSIICNTYPTDALCSA